MRYCVDERTKTLEPNGSFPNKVNIKNPVWIGTRLTDFPQTTYLTSSSGHLYRYCPGTKLLKFGDIKWVYEEYFYKLWGRVPHTRTRTKIHINVCSKNLCFNLINLKSGVDTLIVTIGLPPSGIRGPTDPVSATKVGWLGCLRTGNASLESISMTVCKILSACSRYEYTDILKPNTSNLSHYYRR